MSYQVVINQVEGVTVLGSRIRPQIRAVVNFVYTEKHEWLNLSKKLVKQTIELVAIQLTLSFVV